MAREQANGVMGQRAVGTTLGWELSVPAALRLNVGPNPYLSADREEGVRAFLEKRPPRWTGK